MIRVQQDQISALQPASPTSSDPSSQHASTVRPTTDAETRSRTTSSAGIPLNLMQASHPRSPSQRPVSLSRQSSRAASGIRNTSQSPALRPMSNHDAHRDEWMLGSASASRDDHAFYQAETQSLTRENQMLKQRIRELGQSLYHPRIVLYTANTFEQNDRWARRARRQSAVWGFMYQIARQQYLH